MAALTEWKPIVAYPDGRIDGYPGFIEGWGGISTISRKGAGDV